MLSSVSKSRPKQTKLGIARAPDAEPRKSDRTREEILAAALDFLLTRPFRDFTVAELMKMSGLSRSAFYQYFDDAYDLIRTLLRALEEEIRCVAAPWFTGKGAPLPLLRESLTNLVQIGYERGPILRAVADAAVSDERLEQEWTKTLTHFDDAITSRIEQQQKQGWVPSFEARPVAEALNRMDASLLIHAFGRQPKGDPQPVVDALYRVWSATLYPTLCET
ncbi:TetR/AcrR family transcriptional regulator [Rubripirellula amarantea]|nr:TetR/AcrR family transcriptional regulator [Rubripirellula amarantea]